MISQYACSSPYTHPLKSSSKQLLKIAVLYFISLQATVPTFSPNAILDTTPDSLVKICLSQHAQYFLKIQQLPPSLFQIFVEKHQRIVTNTHETEIYK